MPEGLSGNRVLLAGVLVDTVHLRESPAGIPVARFALDHRSEQQEAGVSRIQTLRIGVRAAGDGLCRGLDRLPPGAPLEVRGHLARSDQREDYRLVICAERITRLAMNESSHQE